MPLIQKDEIPTLVDLFTKRNVTIHHACQLQDLRTYIQLGGIPSRNLLEASGRPYTPFDTDSSDKKNEVWTKVFGNLSDFGFWYAYAKRNENTAPTPNPFGPILLRLRPEAMNEAEDVAICLRSAGGRDFSRDNESLGSIDDVNRLFVFSIDDAPDEYKKASIKFAPQLKQEFGNKLAMSPEVSFTVKNQKLSLDYLEPVIVDPYVVNGMELLDSVNKEFEAGGIWVQVWGRRYKEENRINVINELARALHEREVGLNEFADNEEFSPDLRDWAGRLRRGNMEFEFNRYSGYLRKGTLLAGMAT